MTTRDIRLIGALARANAYGGLTRLPSGHFVPSVGPVGGVDRGPSALPTDAMPPAFGQDAGGTVLSAPSDASRPPSLQGSREDFSPRGPVQDETRFSDPLDAAAAAEIERRTRASSASAVRDDARKGIDR